MVVNGMLSKTWANHLKLSLHDENRPKTGEISIPWIGQLSNRVL